jgi:hypothetical protein
MDPPETFRQNRWIETEHGIKRARVVVAILTPTSQASNWVDRQLTFADQLNVPIIPVLAAGDRDSIPLRLIPIQFFDARESMDGLGASVARHVRSHVSEQEPTLPAVEEVRVQLVGQLGHDAVAVVEPLLGAISEAIGEGRFDEDPLTLRTLERDQSSLRAELYENSESLDTGIILATVYRVLRTLGPALLDRQSLALLPTDAADPLDPEQALDAAHVLADAAGAPPEPLGLTTYEWVLIQLGWYPHAAAEVTKQLAGDAAELVSAGSGAAGVLALLGLGGWAATLVGAYIGLLSVAWRNRDEPSG